MSWRRRLWLEREKIVEVKQRRGKKWSVTEEAGWREARSGWTRAFQANGRRWCGKRCSRHMRSCRHIDRPALYNHMLASAVWYSVCRAYEHRPRYLRHSET